MRKGLIWLAGWPHCGSTLLRTFIRDTFGLRCYSKYTEPELAFAFGPESVEFSQDWPQSREMARQSEEPILVKTHELPPDEGPVIYVARDGRDAIASLARFWGCSLAPLIFEAWQHDERRRPGCGVVLRAFYGNWSTHFHAWNPLQHPQALVIRFPDILAEPEQTRLRLAQFLGRPPTGDWHDHFAEYQERWPAMYDDHHDELRGMMQGELLGLFWRVHGEVMRLLDFDERNR